MLPSGQNCWQSTAANQLAVVACLAAALPRPVGTCKSAKVRRVCLGAEQLLNAAMEAETCTAKVSKKHQKHLQHELRMQPHQC